MRKDSYIAKTAIGTLIAWTALLFPNELYAAKRMRLSEVFALAKISPSN